MSQSNTYDVIVLGPGGMGLKVAEHVGGERVDDPDEVSRTLGPGDTDGVDAFIREVLAGFDPTLTRFSVCMYSTTPDEHFIIDRRPEHPNVVIGAGFSGHGFKFFPVMGEILADLSTQGDTHHRVGFLNLDRLLT